MQGYHGKFLKVDLSAGTLGEIPLAESDLRAYIGGATLAAALIYGQVRAGMDPLAPESPLVFATGPLTGSSIPMVSRYAVCGISPQTGYWGEATSGGSFPFRLKGAGYDGLLITGRAESPVYLHIDRGSAELRDAGRLWGRDIYETQRLLKDESLGEKPSIACIMNDRGRAAGRCGLGALMGSKNLKAVAASGGSKTETADRDTVKALAQEAQAVIKGHLVSLALKEYGTLFYMDMAMALGDAPARYFSRSVFPADKLSGQALRQAYTVENYSCLGCPIGCGREVKHFRQDIPRVDGPEYETVGALGPLCLNYDLESIVEANHLCNAYGMDTISTGVSIAYAMHLAGQGALPSDPELGELTWGDGRAIVKLVRMIAERRGLGRLLGEGALAMAQALGRDPDEAAQVKGLEMPMHDARAFHGMAVSYATGPRGACHLKGDYYNVDMGVAVAEFDIRPGMRFGSQNKGESAAKYQGLKDLYDALTICKFSPLGVTQLVKIVNAITGWEMTPADLLAAGLRSLNLKRAINNKLGLTRRDDRLPRVCLRALEEGSTAGREPAMETMLQDYYQFMGWDWETGRPGRARLLELGLGHVAEDLYQQ